MQRHSVASLETSRSLANGPSDGGLRGEFPGNFSVSYLYFVYGSTRGVCGRILKAEKILFTRRQACSLYLVLWLCGNSTPWPAKVTAVFSALSLKK